MKVTLHYRLAGDRRVDRRVVKIIRAIVAGHERAVGLYRGGDPGLSHATVRGGLVRLVVPAQLAEAANWWVEQVLFRGWDAAAEDRESLRVLNHLTLIFRCGAILVPQNGPNGGYALRNGAPKSGASTVIPQAKCSRLRVD